MQHTPYTVKSSMASAGILYSEELSGRTILSLSGDSGEQEDFLQSLVTNDIARAAPDTLVYAALLTPQGKYLADFFIWRSATGDFQLDVASALAGDLVRRLTMYRLRRPLEITGAVAPVTACWGADPGHGALRDPRHPDLGWRSYSPLSIDSEPGDYDLHRLKLGIPESGTDLLVNDSYILEAGFERLHGVDFRKGCYVGQEIVARMKFKTELRKGLCPVTVTGSAPPQTALHTSSGKLAGHLLSNRDGYGLAHLRYDRADGALSTSNEGAVIRKTIESNYIK